MKKKGFLFTILIVVLVLALLTAGAMLMFSIKEFDVEYSNNVTNINKADFESYITKYHGDSTFLFSKNEFVEDVQNKFPYVVIQNVERIPFSTVKVTLTERLPVFAINYNSKYYKFDINGILVGISETNEAEVGQTACIEVTGIDSKLLVGIDEKVGTIPEFFKTDEKAGYILQYFDVMKRLDYNYTDFQLKSFIETIEIDFEKNLIVETNIGVELWIYDFDVKTEDKIKAVMAVYTNPDKAIEPDSKLIVSNDLTITLTK